ncbi:Vacuolar ATPase assembly integral membrane protein vma21 [Lonchura striata]|uniref:Vacuolar ATPase assembly integral membrane protein vma21 n=2 Tax=Neoaves TaxID=3078114 RepID=A0A218V4I5_9PASE|nr:Vacuolar ATPase assembly integral membrane protein vma21 [Lonchura striata domestica]
MRCQIITEFFPFFVPPPFPLLFPYNKLHLGKKDVELITNILYFFVFSGSLGMSDRDSYFYAAIVAVVTVHVVLALFVYVAWNEGSRQWREGKQD